MKNRNLRTKEIGFWFWFRQVFFFGIQALFKQFSYI